MKLSKNIWGRVAASAAIALAVGVAHADTYDFTLTGDYTAHWQLASSPTPDFSATADHFSLFDVPGTFSGATSSLVDLYFYNAALSGGIAINDDNADQLLLLADGGQLYSGPESAPTFLLGSFALIDDFDTGNTYTLTITDVSAVPEPTSYALLLVGLGAVGAIVARRRKAA